MNIKELNSTINNYLERLKFDDYSEQVIGTNRWVLGHFEKHCKKEGLEEIDIATAADFLLEKYDIDYRNTITATQTVLRRPLLTLMEFYESGNYLKSHQRGSTTEMPIEYREFLLKYRDFVNAQPIGISSKERKLWAITVYCTYLVKQGITDVTKIRLNDAHHYIASLTDFASETRRNMTGIIREACNWMYGEGMISFTGRQAFPLLKKAHNPTLLSYFSREEVMQLLDTIDTAAAIGKRDYFLISIFSFLGLRAGDVINLRLGDIDWGNDMINIIQQKTKAPLTLPLIDEVKYPLIDYLKNARPKCIDCDYVLVTRHAPHTKYKCSGSLGRIITKCLDNAGINYEGTPLFTQMIYCLHLHRINPNNGLRHSRKFIAAISRHEFSEKLLILNFYA